jgi:ABC-type bacteriocin/lantibiotic exporter with double-glycine peptidase domain
LLDEATSHLDVKREREVNEALRYVRATRVVIAHRPETIRAADRVITIGAQDDDDLQISHEGNVTHLAPVD